jgi:formylglycine-generating enzyme required for sulfatase activity
VWYDLSGLEGGSRWNQEIEDAIGASQYFIVVLSPNSIVSTWVKEEILYARGLERKIVPLLYKPCVIPLGLNTLNYVNVQGANYQQNYQEILRALGIERSKREAAEKARLAARKAILEKIFSNISSAFQRLLSDSRPILRFIGMIIIATILFWAGSWAIPKFVALIPAPLSPTMTPKPSSTPLIPTKIITPINAMTLAALPAEIVDDNGVTMHLIPAGEFTMGSESGATDEKPVHQVYLNAFYMDIYEVTNAAYNSCVDAGYCTLPKNISSDTRSDYYNTAVYNDFPVINVDWNQAKAYCEWRSANLPTEAQWEKAARGTEIRVYPWGDNISCSYANHYEAFTECDSNADTTRVGSYEDGKSQYGIYDLAGNVWEWTADWYLGTYYQNSSSSNPQGPETGQYRVLRGGSWRNGSDDIRSTRRFSAATDNFGEVFGFRCVLNIP